MGRKGQVQERAVERHSEGRGGISSVQQAGRIDDPPKEITTRARLKAGELGLDIYGIRGKPKRMGLVYRHCESEA